MASRACMLHRLDDGQGSGSDARYWFVPALGRALTQRLEFSLWLLYKLAGVFRFSLVYVLKLYSLMSWLSHYHRAFYMASCVCCEPVRRVQLDSATSRWSAQTSPW